MRWTIPIVAGLTSIGECVNRFLLLRVLLEPGHHSATVSGMLLEGVSPVAALNRVNSAALNPPPESSANSPSLIPSRVHVVCNLLRSAQIRRTDRTLRHVT
jgi:hypothetical protein